MVQIDQNILLVISMGFLVLGLLLSFARLVRGPSTADRVIALELIASIAMGFILVYSLIIRKQVYLDIPVVIALISFIGTVAISTYLKQKQS